MKRFALILLVLGTFIPQANGQVEKVKAVFIYKFSQYVRWPAPKTNEASPFIVMVAGDAELEAQLNTLLNGRSVHGMDIQVVPFSENQVATAHLLYLGKDYIADLEKYTQQALDNQILLVAQSPGAGVQGAHVNFIPNGTKLEFEINESFIGRAGLRIPGALRSLAVSIY